MGNEKTMYVYMYVLLLLSCFKKAPWLKVLLKKLLIYLV